SGTTAPGAGRRPAAAAGPGRPRAAAAPGRPAGSAPAAAGSPGTAPIRTAGRSRRSPAPGWPARRAPPGSRTSAGPAPAAAPGPALAPPPPAAWPARRPFTWFGVRRQRPDPRPPTDASANDDRPPRVATGRRYLPGPRPWLPWGVRIGVVGAGVVGLAAACE